MENEQELKEKYDKYTDSEIQEKLNSGIIKYHLLIETEKIAKDILKDYDIHFFYQHEDFKKEFRSLIIYAKTRSLLFNEESFYQECDYQDIIKRIMENFHKHIDMLHEYAYQYIGYLGNNLWNNDVDFKIDNGLEIKLDEINALYLQIVNDIKSAFSSKKKVK